MRIVKAGAVLVLLVALAGARPALAEEKSATLSLINPGPGLTLKDLEIKHVIAALDGQRFGDCQADQKQLGDLCVPPEGIHSGPHILDVTLDPLRSTYFRKLLKFTAGLDGDWVFDLKALTAATPESADFGRHRQLLTVSRREELESARLSENG